MSLEGKVALVAGGTRGIGAATSRILAEQGAIVAASYWHHDDKAEALAGSIREKGGRIELYKSDARQAEHVKDLVKAVFELEGRLDIVVHSVPGQGVMKPFLYLTWDEFMLATQSELKSVYEIAHASIPYMRERHSGHLVFVCSEWAKHPNMPVLSGLAPAFGAMVSLAKALAFEYGKDGIMVNTVAPGMVDTELSAKLPADIRARVVDVTPLGRIATPDDVARVIAFLASDASSFMTGTYLPVNGGVIMD